MGLDLSPPPIQLRSPSEDSPGYELASGLSNAQEQYLVAQLQSNDPEAIATLMEQYANRLARFAYQMVGAWDIAEDIVQQVFIQLWDQRMTLSPDSHLKAYLFRLVRIRARNERKAFAVRERHRESVQADTHAESEKTFIPNPEDDLLTDLTLQAAVRQLSERRRQALRLRFIEGMTHAEIAETLEVTLATAKHLVARAVADLRKILWGNEKR